jgi:hypothetical protein
MAAPRQPQRQTGTMITANSTLMESSSRTVVEQLLRDKPSFHLDGICQWNSLPETRAAIRDSVKPGDVTLETGVGASTVVFAACGAHHTAISPSAREHARVAEYCERIGVDTSRLTFIEGLSEDELPARLTRERTLDVAVIDGAHSFPFPEVDWFYVTRALKIGGKLLMDDIPIPAVTPLFHHMQLEDNWRLDGIFDDRAVAFTLVAPPAPEDWPNQRFNGAYPDYSFAGLPKRLRLTAKFQLARARSRAARRYPALKRVYRQAASRRSGLTP